MMTLDLFLCRNTNFFITINNTTPQIFQIPLEKCLALKTVTKVCLFFTQRDARKSSVISVPFFCCFNSSLRLKHQLLHTSSLFSSIKSHFDMRIYCSKPCLLSYTLVFSFCVLPIIFFRIQLLECKTTWAIEHASS